MNTINKNPGGFTLIELVFVAGILAVVLTGMIQLFIHTSVTAELSGNKTLAVAEAHNKLEEMRNHSFDLIATDYASGGTPGDTFNLTNLTGKGKIYIDNSNPSLLTLKVVIAWQNKYNRIVGEDLDLDGTLDGGEDTDSD